MSSYFKLAVPVDLQEIRDILEKEFPEFRFRMYGIGKGIILVSKEGSEFTGARIVKVLGTYRITPTQASYLWRVLNRLTFGLFNTPSSYKLCRQLQAFLIERFN